MALSYPDTNALTAGVIASAIEVHRQLGPGLLESIYEECLYIELCTSGYPLARQRQVPVIFKGRRVEGFYRPDFVVSEAIIVEVKAVEKLLPVHEAAGPYISPGYRLACRTSREFQRTTTD